MSHDDMTFDLAFISALLTSRKVLTNPSPRKSRKVSHRSKAASGSMFVGRFLSDVTEIDATTGASIHIEKLSGKLIGPVKARHAGTVSLPDRNVFSPEKE